MCKLPLRTIKALTHRVNHVDESELKVLSNIAAQFHLQLYQGQHARDVDEGHHAEVQDNVAQGCCDGDDALAPAGAHDLLLAGLVPHAVDALHVGCHALRLLEVELDGVDDGRFDALGIGEEHVLGEADEEGLGGHLDLVVVGAALGNVHVLVLRLVAGQANPAGEGESQEGVDDTEADGRGEANLSGREEGDPEAEHRCNEVDEGHAPVAVEETGRGDEVDDGHDLQAVRGFPRRARRWLTMMAERVA